MGLGVTGLANAAEAFGFPYGSPAFLQFERKVLLAINEGCYRAGVELARRRARSHSSTQRLR
jgi:ribonucleoside-diphosphate reductase alpha chain